MLLLVDVVFSDRQSNQEERSPGGSPASDEYQRGQNCWPPPGSYMAASGHLLMAADSIVGRSTFGSKSDATVWLSTVQADKSRGDFLDPRLAQRVFSEWATEWLAGLSVKPKTLVGYESSLRNHVLPAFARRPVGSITYRDCKQLIDDKTSSGLAPGTVGEARKVLRLVLREALRADAIRRNPAENLRVARGERQEMVFLTTDEVFRLGEAIAHPPRPERHAPRSHPDYGLLVRFAALTGRGPGRSRLSA
ncbi:MAG: N-terminal phage integrase SAM-like domain-containing protein [Acidimicrobiales bacterium]